MDGLRRHLKLIIAVVALLLAGYLFTRNDSPYPQIPDRFDYICVSTGDLFNLSNDEAAMIPARHPQTRKRTLIPCTRNADGSISIEEDFRVLLDGDLSDDNKVVDMETLRVKTGGT